MENLRLRQRDSRFGGEPSDVQSRLKIPALLYGVWASATGRLLRYDCTITKTKLVALYEDENTAALALATARKLDEVHSIAPPAHISNAPLISESAQVLSHTHSSRRQPCGQMLVKSVTLKEVEQEVLCGLHGWEVDGCVVFRCPENRSDVWSEIARVRFR